MEGKKISRDDFAVVFFCLALVFAVPFMYAMILYVSTWNAQMSTGVYFGAALFFACMLTLKLHWLVRLIGMLAGGIVAVLCAGVAILTLVAGL